MTRNKILIYLSVLFFFFSSCDQKRCEDVVCGNNQQCNGGNCFCLDGYEGQDCLDLSADKYVGNYLVNMNCQNFFAGTYTFETIFSNQSPLNEVVFQNFMNSGIQIRGYIGAGSDNMGNYIQIPNQNIGSTASSVAGEGFFQDFGGSQRIQLDVQLVQNGQSNLCTITYQKQ